MSKAEMRRRIEELNKRIADDQIAVTRQRQLIDMLQRNGYTTSDATRFLRSLENEYSISLAAREDLKEAIKKADFTLHLVSSSVN